MDWHATKNLEYLSVEHKKLQSMGLIGYQALYVLKGIRCYISLTDETGSSNSASFQLKEWASNCNLTKNTFIKCIDLLEKAGEIRSSKQGNFLEISVVVKVQLKHRNKSLNTSSAKDYRDSYESTKNYDHRHYNHESPSVVQNREEEKRRNKNNTEEPVCNVSVSLPNSCLSREALKAEAVNQVMNHEQFKSLDESRRDVYVDSMVKFMETSTKDTLLGKTNALKSILNKKAWGLSKEFSARLVSNNPKVQPKIAEMPLNRIPGTSKDWDLDRKINDSENSYNHFIKVGNATSAEIEKSYLLKLLEQKSKVS